MKRFSLGALACTAALAALLIWPATGAAAAEGYPATLSISGTCVTHVAPDTAAITVGVVTEAKDAAKTHADNAARTARVHSAVKALGIADSDIQTTHYDFSQRWDTRDDGRTELVGYTAQNMVVITVHDLSKVGRVIDAALAAGANRIDSLEFTASDLVAAKNTALAGAMRDARAKADALAAAAGVRIVRVSSITSADASMQPYNSIRYAAMAKDAASEFAATPIAAGQLSVEGVVNVTYVIE